MKDSADNSVLIRLDAVAVSAPTGDAVLEDVNWTLRAGEFHVVGGLNWSGKTDWLATVAALQSPLRGGQQLFGVDLTEATRGELAGLRRRIGFVFEQDGRLFTDLNVAENLALPLSYHRDVPVDDVIPDVTRVLRACGLETRATATIADLGRALRRRVALARALAMEPEVLLIDTPLGNADPVQCRWWVDFLDGLHRGEIAQLKAPAAIVVTVEDFRAWLAPNRRFALLNHGRLQDLGDESGLKDSPEPTAREMLTGHA